MGKMYYTNFITQLKIEAKMLPVPMMQTQVKFNLHIKTLLYFSQVFNLMIGWKYRNQVILPKQIIFQIWLGKNFFPINNSKSKTSVLTEMDNKDWQQTTQNM